MNKYLLAGVCVVAFAAGGAAHLMLQKGRTPKADAKVEGTALEAAREEAVKGVAMQEGPARVTAETDQLVTQPDAPQTARTGDAVESSDPSGEDESPRAERAVAHATRKWKRAARVPRAAERRDYRPAASVAARSGARDGGGLKAQTAKGAKGTGRLFGKALKKVGRVFNP
jgi:type IV secretory pathway VirB10-like protein